MSKSVKVYVVRVFVDQEDKFGNPVGIILDEERKIDANERQKISTVLGFSESVFVNDKSTGNVSIYNSQAEVKFAGHAMLGTAWLINNANKKPIKTLECIGGKILTWSAGSLTWIRAPLSIMPPWNYEQLENDELVEDLPLSDTSSKNHTVVWAWRDQNKGIIRARTFAPDWGIAEDQANGSGSMLLSFRLRKEPQIIHGQGSIIFAKPPRSGFSDVGGMVAEDAPRQVTY